jgi:diketogulonate reductase-like aldo/keto reductase
VLHAIRRGARVIDTAMLYRNHDAVGRAIQAALQDPSLALSRSDLCIITKVSDRVQKRGHDAILLALDEALHELQLSYVDYVLLHNALHPIALSQAAWTALVTFQQRGGCRHLGVSNFSLQELQELKALSSSPSSQPRLLQTELSPWSYTTAARALVSWCHQNDVIVQSHSPLVKGRCFEHPLLQRICKTTNQLPAAVLCAWQRSHALWCVVRSSQDEHIDQLFQPSSPLSLSPSDLSELGQLGQQCDASVVTHPKVFRCF